MGPHADDLHHLADGPGLHQLPGVDSGLHLQALAVVDHVLAARLGDGALDVLQLLQSGEGGLVGEVVLARLHHPDAQGGPLAGDAGAGHQLCLRVGQHLLLAFGGDGLGVGLAVGLHLLGVGVVDVLQGGARVQQAAGHAVDVAVVQPHGGKHEFPGLYHRVGLAFRGVEHAVFCCHCAQSSFISSRRSCPR